MKIEQIENKSIARIIKGDRVWAYVLKNYADSVLLDIAGNHIMAKVVGNIGRLSGWVHIKLVSLNPASFEIISATERSDNINSQIAPLNLQESEKSVAAQLKNWFDSSDKVIKSIIDLMGGSTGKSRADDISRILHFYDQANHIQKEKIDQILTSHIKQATTIGNATIYRFSIVYNNKRGTVFLKTDGKRLDIVLNIQLDKMGKIRLIFSDSAARLNVSIILKKKFRGLFEIWSDHIAGLLSDYPKIVNVKFREFQDSDNKQNIEYWA